MLNTAMESGPTVLFAIPLTGSDASPLISTGAALAAVALLNQHIK